MSEKIGCICHYGWDATDPCKVHPYQAYGSLLDETYSTTEGRRGMQMAHEEQAIRADREKLAGLVEETRCHHWCGDGRFTNQCLGCDRLEEILPIIRTTPIGDEK